MKNKILLISVLLSTLAFSQHVKSVELSESGNEIIIITNDDKSAIEAPEGKFWSQIHPSGDGKRFFLILNKKAENGSSWIESVEMYSTVDNSVVEVKVITDLERAKVIKIHSSDLEGSRLLVDVHYKTTTEGKTSYFDTHPYYLNIQNGNLTRIKP